MTGTYKSHASTAYCILSVVQSQFSILISMVFYPLNMAEETRSSIENWGCRNDSSNKIGCIYTASTTGCIYNHAHTHNEYKWWALLFSRIHNMLMVWFFPKRRTPFRQVNFARQEQQTRLYTPSQPATECRFATPRSHTVIGFEYVRLCWLKILRLLSMLVNTVRILRASLSLHTHTKHIYTNTCIYIYICMYV